MAFTINAPNSALVDSRGVITPPWYRFFARIQKILGDEVVSQIVQSPIVTWGPASALSNERVLTDGDGINLALSSDALTIALAPSGVAADDYGDDTHLVHITVDQFGRITAASQSELNSDNVTEGVSNLFFTEDRARAAISAGEGLSYDDTTGVMVLANEASRLGIRTVTGSSAVTDMDYTILCDAAGGPITVTLPEAAGSARRIIGIKKTDPSANGVTIAASGGDLIDGAGTLPITAQWQSYTVHCDGGGWFII